MMDVINRKLVWLVVLCSPLPLCFLNLSAMWRLEHYHYLPALGLAILFLVGSQWDRVWRGPKSVLAANVLAISTLIGLPLALVVFSPLLATIVWIINAGVFLASQQAVSGVSLLRNWPLMWMLLPLPMNLDLALTSWVQLKSSKMSSYFLDILGVPHILLGNVIELADRKLFVEEACSGVQSLFTLVFCAWLIVVALGRPILLLPFYTLAAIFWAGLMNILRIVGIAVVGQWFAIDISKGWQHEIWGYLCLGIAATLLLSTDRLLRVFFFPVRDENSGKARSNPIVIRWNKMLYEAAQRPNPAGGTSSAYTLSVWMLVAIAIVAGISLLGQTYLCYSSMTRSVTSAPRPDSQPFLELPESLAIAGFQQEAREKLHGRIDLPIGENADVWRGSIDGMPVALSISQPYPGWHELSGCYTGIGWTINDRYVERESKVKPWDFVTTRWMCPGGTYGYVWYCAIDEFGAAVEVFDRSILTRFKAALARGQMSNKKFAMIQLVSESDAPYPPDAVQALEKAYFGFRNQLSEIAKAQKP